MRSRNKKKKDVNKILYTTLRSDTSGQFCPAAITEIQLELDFESPSNMCCVQFAMLELSVVCFLFLLAMNILILKNLGTIADVALNQGTVKL